MSIDWITVSAQVVNFLILVWLLKRFLYGPIIRAMDAREQRVTVRLKQAEQREQEAEEQRQRFNQQQAELEQHRAQALTEAAREADRVRHDLLQEARTEVAALRENWRQQATSEQSHFLTSLQEKTVACVLQIARKALGDLANAQLDDQLITTFIEKLDGVEAAPLTPLAKHNAPIAVVSSHTLTKAQQDRIADAICQWLGVETRPIFELSPELGFGLQMNFAEHRLGWNLASYLDDIGSEYNKALARHTSA